MEYKLYAEINAPELNNRKSKRSKKYCQLLRITCDRKMFFIMFFRYTFVFIQLKLVLFFFPRPPRRPNEHNKSVWLCNTPFWCLLVGVDWITICDPFVRKPSQFSASMYNFIIIINIEFIIYYLLKCINCVSVIHFDRFREINYVKTRFSY